MDLDSSEAVRDGRSEFVSTIGSDGLVGDQVAGSSELELGDVVLELLDDDLLGGGRSSEGLVLRGSFFFVIVFGVTHDSNELLQVLDFLGHLYC